MRILVELLQVLIPGTGGLSARAPATLLLVLLASPATPGTAQVQPKPPPPDTLSASDYLGLLPDGEEKRRFILDCTGCHPFHKGIGFPDGDPRTRDGWAEAVTRMLAYTATFPVISADRGARETADFLGRWVTALPERSSRPAEGSAAMGASGAPGWSYGAADVVEFDFPVPQDLPHDVMVAGDGQVLVTGMFTHRVWLLDPGSGDWSWEEIPVQQANPRALDLGEDGRWWLLLGGPAAIARKDARSGEWSHYDVGVYPHSIVDDGRGRVWFNGHFTKDPPLLGYVDAASGEVRTFEAPVNEAFAQGSGPIPYGLRAAPDGRVWMTELQGNRIVGLDPESGDFRKFSMPASHSGPRRPDFDAEGVLWIPEYAAGKLARFDPATETFTEYPLPISDALPYVVRVDRRGDRVWIGTGAADAVLAFDPQAERFTIYDLPTRGALIRHIDVDQETGDVWAAYGASPGIPAKIARVRAQEVAMGQASFESAEAGSALREVVDTERSFARTAASEGTRTAFLRYLAEDGIVFDDTGPVDGPELWRGRVASEALLAWQPAVADAASSGDMGYTTGPWSFHPEPGGEATAHGIYLTVWGRQDDGSFRALIDHGTSSQAVTDPSWARGEAPGAPGAGAEEHAEGGHEAEGGDALDHAHGRGPELEQLLAFDGHLSDEPAMAFRHHGARDVIVIRDGRMPARGAEGLEILEAEAPEQSWRPVGGGVSRGGDLGYTYGTLEIAVEEGEVKRGSYLRIWRRVWGGGWTLAVDLRSGTS